MSSSVREGLLMKVLSLFDGIACGHVALERSGITVDRYVAYEIEQNAIKIAKKNYPDIEERGDVFKADFTEFKDFDLLIGGSPCTNWSIAKAGHGRETTSSGIGWELFQQYIRAWKESGVKYYLYENNASMSKEIRAAISEAFGREPIEINSSLVSAQTRKRLYWTNIPGACVPDDTGVKLSDIIEHGIVDRDKSLCLARRYAGFQGSQSYLCRRYLGKSMGQAVFEGDPTKLKELYRSNDRFTDEEGSATGCVIRPMTETECERLQTLPDGYTDGAGCSRLQRIEAIGNGWTVNVIVHLMKGLCNETAELEDIVFPEITPEPGFVYSCEMMDVISNLTDEDFNRLPRVCSVCGKDINHEHIISAVDDRNEVLHPICMDCETMLKDMVTLNEFRSVAGVATDKELVDWIIEASLKVKVPSWM